MPRDFDVDGKWLGDHVQSCQREKCTNPTGNLINCFSCERAFCEMCWKTVSKMPLGVKAAKGFTSCSIEPRSQNPPPQMLGRTVLPRRQPRDSSNQPGKLRNSLQHVPKAQSKYVVLSDSDDSGNETEKTDNASPASMSNSSARDILSARKPQQQSGPFQPSKRHFEDSTEGMGEQTSKRSKSSASSSFVPVSSDKSSRSPSFPMSQSSPSIYSHDGQNDDDKGTRYISEGRYHALQEWAMEHTSVEPQNKEKSIDSHQTDAREGAGVLRDTPTIGGRRQPDRTSDMSNDVDPIENAGASTTLAKEDGQRAGYPSNEPTENCNVAVGVQCESLSEQQSGSSAMTSHAGKAGSVEPVSASYSTTAPGFAEPQDRTQHGPSVSSAGTTVQTGAQTNPILQAQQIQPQIYHRHILPRSQSLTLQDTSAPVQRTLFEANSTPGCSASSGYSSQPAQSLADHGIGTVGLSPPSTVPIQDQSAAQQVVTQPACPTSRPPPFNYAFTEQDIESLPADQIKTGDGWFVQYNPQLPRVIDVSLLHTFRHESVVCCVRFSPDGKCIATGSNRTVQMFDALSGHILWILRIDSTDNPRGDMYIRCVCFSPDGKYLATGSEDAVARIWDVDSKQIRHTLRGHEGDIYSLDFASDSRTLATGSADCTVRLWDTEAGTQIWCLTAGAREISSVTISPDISFVAAGCYDNSIQVWSIATGFLVGHLKGQDGHTAPVNSVAFSPNGKGLVSGSLDKTVKMWDLDTSNGNHLTLGPEGGKCYGTFEDHGDLVLSVAMTPDGAWVLSGSKDKGVHFSNPRAGSCQLRIQAHLNSVISVAANPVLTTSGARLFATGSGDNEAKIWAYAYIPSPQNSQAGTLGNRESIPDGPQSSQTSQPNVQQPLSKPQGFQSPLQKPSTPAQSRPAHTQQVISPNIQSQQHMVQTNANSTSQRANINVPGGPSDSSQQSSQPSLPPRNFIGNAANASQISNTPRAVTSPEEAVRSHAQQTTNTGPAVINRGRKQTGLDLVDKIVRFAVQAPQAYTQQLERHCSVRDSLPQDEEPAQHQEKRVELEGAIQNVETSYRDLMQYSSEEEKNDLMTIKERAVSARRQLLEKHDKLGEDYRAARENKAEMEFLKQQLTGMKASIPDAIRALQNFLVFLNRDFDL